MTISTLVLRVRRASEISPRDERTLRLILRLAQRLSPDMRKRLAAALGEVEGEIPEWVGAN